MNPELSRRNLLKRLGIAGVASCLCGMGRAEDQPRSAAKLAKEPAAIYPFKIGDLQAVIISDGTLTVKPPFPALAATASLDKVNALLEANLQPIDKITLSLNVMVLQIGPELVLFDSGVGHMRGPACGWLTNNLKAAGIDPRDITSVLLSHAHSDHFGGLTNSDHQLAFPNAKLFANPVELDFWLSPEPDLTKCFETPEFKKAQVKRAHTVLLPIRKAFEPMKPGDTLFGCVEVMEAYGHTPGHLNYRITSGGETFIHVVDLGHSYILQIQRPDWATSFDVWPETGVVSRKRILTELATSKGTMMGYHLPFPGIGKIGLDGEGYRWFPAPWQWG